MTPEKIKRKIDNVELAMTQLLDFVKIKNPARVEIAGVIQGFEFTLEVFWKCFKAIAESKAYQIDSPRAAISAALNMGFIENEDTWVSMLKDRNETSHTYNESVAKDIHARICGQYAREFSETFSRIKKI